MTSGELQNITNKTDEFLEVKTGNVLHYNRQTQELIKIGNSEFRSGSELVKQPKKPFVLNDEALIAFAEELHMNPAVAKMFFAQFNDTLYVKIPGLLALATEKRPYQAIQIPADSIKKNEAGEWSATCYVYPRVGIKEMSTISAVQEPELRRKMWDYLSMPTVGYGRASRDNVKLAEVRDKFLPEMAQTRAVARALRLYTGFGFTAAEEMQDAVPDMNVQGYKYVPDGPVVQSGTAVHPAATGKQEPEKKEQSKEKVKQKKIGE